MSHKEQLEFVKEISILFPENFRNSKVLEIGSLIVNGTIRGFFENCNYVGIDIAKGKGVDIVCEGQNYDAPNNFFDTVISCESFEHNPYWSETFKNMIRVCNPGGLVIFTCATTGRPEHGTSRTTPADSPLTTLDGWDYYKNLTEADFIEQTDFDAVFSVFEFRTNSESKDLYFYGLKNKLTNNIK